MCVCVCPRNQYQSIKNNKTHINSSYEPATDHSAKVEQFFINLAALLLEHPDRSAPTYASLHAITCLDVHALLISKTPTSSQP